MFNSDRIRPLCDADVDFLAGRLREEDVREVETASGDSAGVAILRGHSLSLGGAFVGLGHDGRPFCVFGVVPMEDGFGNVWMLATPEMERNKTVFLRTCQNVLSGWQTLFRLLGNAVDSRNTLHIKWLRWCGFTFLRAVPVGKDNVLFYEFVKLGGRDV